jgi:hypothetical protein
MPSFLGACTSWPVLHGKIDELRSRIVSLEADLKVPIPTSYSTYELHVVQNLELSHYVDHLQDENDELKKCLSWLLGQEPQLVLTVISFIKIRLDLQADKSSVVVKGPFIP